VLALGLHWLLQRRYALLVPLGFLYVWLYNAFPLLLLLAHARAKLCAAQVTSMRGATARQH
jgi:hypothetical protein